MKVKRRNKATLGITLTAVSLLSAGGPVFAQSSSLTQLENVMSPAAIGHIPLLYMILAAVAGLLVIAGCVSPAIFWRKYRSALKKGRLNRLLLEYAGEGIYCVDSRGITTFINPAAEKLLGYTAAEIIGTSMHAVVHLPLPGVKTLAEESCPVHASCRDGSVHQGTDSRFLRGDGTVFPVFYSSRPIYDHGRITGAVVCFRDITEEKRKEDEIRANQERLRSLVRILEKHHESVQDLLDNSLDEALSITGSKIGYIYFYDDDREEFILNSWSKGVMDLCNITEKQTTYQLCCTGIWGEAVRQGRPIILNDFHAPHPLRKGYPKGHAELSRFLTVPISSGGRITAVIGVANKENPYDESDIAQLTLLMDTVWQVTERKRAEDELRRSELIVSQCRDIIIQVRREDGRIVDANSAAIETYGYNREEFLSLYIKDLRGDGTENLTAEQVRQADLDGILFETIHLRKDGATFPVEVSSKGFTFDGKRILISVIRDITERKQAEERLLATNRELAVATERARELAVQAEQANRAKSQFLANMSHEIRTPMNGVIGMTGLLLETDLAPEQRQYAEIVRTSGESLLGLLNDILDFSKIEAGRMDIEVIDLDIPGLVNSVGQLLSTKAVDKGIKLSWSVDPEVPLRLLGDPARLRQVLVNLGGNAVKFTHSGEILIHVSVDKRVDDLVTVRFSVSDTGIGIPWEMQPNLFSPFTQVDGSITRRYGGSGLGLAISKQLVELMGGNIGLVSEEGAGSTFWFAVPLKIRTAEVMEEPCRDDTPSKAAEKPGSQTISKILVVEDNPTNQYVAVAILEKLGCTADVAGNGEEALAALRSRHYDLVLMDCQMPVMDGFETTRIIRDGHSRILQPSIPVIAMTASAMKGDRDRCLAAGMDDYLTKPVQPAELAAMLERWAVRKELSGVNCINLCGDTEP